jgi:Protein of unknown function (DUF2975)
MPHANPALLGMSRNVLRLLILLNLLLGLGILALLVASLVAERDFLVMLGARGEAPPSFILGMRLIMLIGIANVPLAYLLLTRLLAIVDTVWAGDPFVRANAARLHTIAWSLLGLELLHLAVGAVAAAVSSPTDPLDIGWSFSVTGWLAVLLLFVLARVFDQGARMRDDLEGTI